MESALVERIEPRDGSWCRAVPAIGLLLGSLALSVATSASGQAPADRFSDVTTTMLVEIPVEVTLDGEPVRGLTAENFSVWDDGDRVSIEGLDVVDLSVLEADDSGKVDTREMPVVARRHFLLLFDLSFASPASVTRARAAAAELVKNDLHPADLVSVATYSLGSGARLLLGFTSDREQVAVAIAGLGAPSSVKVRSDPLRLYVGTLEQGVGDDSAIQGSAGGERGNMIADQMRTLQQMADKARATQSRSEVSSMTRSLSELAETLSGVDGRKHVVFFSEGFDSGLLLGATEEGRRSEIVRRAQDNALWEVDSSEYFGSADTLGVLEDMARSFRRADCTIHTVDVGGLRAGGQAAGGRGGGKDGLFMMASNTGGSFYDNFNDLGEAMGQMLEKTSVTYVLRYQPRKLESDGSYRKLKVELEGLPRKARISHRAGYYAPDANQAPSAAEMQLELAQRLLDGRSGGAIGVDVLATPLRPAVEPSAAGADPMAEQAYVPVLVEVDGASFLAAPADPPTTQKERKKRRSRKNRAAESASSESAAANNGLMRAELFLYAMASDGSIADFHVQSVELDLRNVGEALKRRGFKVYAPLMLGQGYYDLRVLVRNSKTGRTGLTVSALEVAEQGPESSILLPPLFPESSEEWILVRGRREELAGREEPPYPFFHGSTTYVPAARPQLRPGQGLPVFLAGYGLGTVESMETRLIGPDGASVATPRWKIDPRMKIGEDGLERHIAAFEVPVVRPGDHVLELSLLSTDGVDSTIGRLPIRILAPEEQTPQRLLALSTPVKFDDGPGIAGAGSARALAQRPERSPASAEEEAMEMGEFEDAYRRVLSRLPVAGRITLVPELASLEHRTLGEASERRVGRLMRSEMRIAKRLAKQDPEALVPMMLLHQDLYLEHKIRRRPHLELHSRQLVRKLADLYVEESRGSEGSKVVAARALTSLAGHLQVDGRRASLDVFEHAVAVDPSNEAALLGLAAYYEKRGGPYRKVVDYLKRLVERRPDSREARLRLAINQLRLATEPDALNVSDALVAAEGHLEHLLDQEPRDWMYSLAAQELARHRAEHGKTADAVKVLERALAEMPGEQKLRLQLAFLLDRSSRPQMASRVIGKMVESMSVASPSHDATAEAGGSTAGARLSSAARGRYNRWPETALADDRRELAAGAQQRLLMLASAARRGGDRSASPTPQTTSASTGGDR